MTNLDRLTELLVAASLPLSGVSILANGRPVEPGWLVITRADGLRVRVDMTNPSAQNITDATSTVMNADLTAPALAAASLTALRTLTKAYVDQSDNALYTLIRAVTLVSMDEINTLRQWIEDFKGAVAAATSLADLKTRVANITPASLPQRTASQAKTAVKNRADTDEAN